MSMTAIGGPWLSLPGAAAPRSGAVDAPDEAARRRFFERFSTARQARIRHEIFLRVERLLAGRGLDTGGRPVGQELPALLVVLEVGDHDLVEHLLVHGGIEDRAQHLDAAIE